MIALFGALGAVSRYWLSGLMYRWFGENFPYGTLGVNVLGCFLLGLISHLLQEAAVSESWRMPLCVGFLGSLTTFSTFGYETFKLMEDGSWNWAFANVAVQLFVGILAVWAGVTAGRMLVGGA